MVKKGLLVVSGIVTATLLTVAAILLAQSREKSDAPIDVTPDRLRQVAESAKGALAPLARHPHWSGNRLRVTGLLGDRIVTEPVGTWAFSIRPDPDTNVVELGGLVFAGEPTFLDLDTDTLTIGGELFRGQTVSGTSPMFDGLPFVGVRFEKGDGEVTGKASILFLQDGRVVMDFYHLTVRGVRAGTYGVLTGSPP